MTKPAVLKLVSFVALSLASTHALAHEVRASAPTPDREGLTLGVGLGAGRLQLEKEDVQAEEQVGISMRAGLGLSQNLLLQATLEGTHAGTSNEGALDLGFAGVSATAYLLPRLFISFGIGYSALAWSDAEGDKVGETEATVAFAGGVGVELIQTTHFALNLELRALTAKFGESQATGGNLLLGVQFF